MNDGGHCTPHSKGRHESAELHLAMKDQAMADIVASPQRFIKALVKARPALDPEAERARALKKVTKGLEKREAQKAAAAKAKMNVKRSTDSSKAAAVPKKAKTKKPTPKKPASKKPASKKKD
ncbi:hypothetical protein GGI19_001256 [Coemansia pectinata]|uniref:Uncharacterized protein n=1 Tax=Coemansia pectinata TaxID=1052879 RepID=A0A9W8LBF5_9FUNG|nr:hypothetical protein GGI19_001256 [Coemansia pectinata]